MIDLSKDGTFNFDALSTDGKLLYLSQAADATGRPVDKIRAYDIVRGALNPDPVVDKTGGSEAMSGTTVARTRSQDGSGVYTVYEGPEHPFVHALLTDMQISVCIDLPAEPATAGATGKWTIELSDDGRVLTATSERLGKSFVMDVTDTSGAARRRLTVSPRRGAGTRRPPTRAPAGNTSLPRLASSSIVEAVCSSYVSQLPAANWCRLPTTMYSSTLRV